MGLLNTLAQTDQAGRQSMVEGVQGMFTAQKRAKLRESVRAYFQEYGMDLSPDNLKAWMNKTGAGIEGVNVVTQAVKQFKGAQVEGQYSLSPGAGRYGPEGLIEERGFKPTETPAEKLERAKSLERFKNKFRGYKPKDESAAIRLKKAGKLTTHEKVAEKKAMIKAGVISDPKKATLAGEKLKIVELWKKGSITEEQKRFINIDKPLQGEMTEPAAAKLFSDLGLMHGLEPEDVATATKFFITKRSQGKSTKQALFETLDEIKDIALMKEAEEYETPEDLKNSDLSVNEKVRIAKKKWPNQFH